MGAATSTPDSSFDRCVVAALGTKNPKILRAYRTFVQKMTRLLQSSQIMNQCEMAQAVREMQDELCQVVRRHLNVVVFKAETPMQFSAYEPETLAKTHNTLRLMGKLANGSYGTTHNSVLNGNAVVVKIPKKHAEAGFLTESLFQILLTCAPVREYYLRVHAAEKLSSLPEFPIPEVNFLIMAKQSHRLPEMLLGMRGLAWTLDTLMRRDMLRGGDLVEILLQLVCKLAGLQAAVGFEHRDLHPNNVMCTRRAVPAQITYANGQWSKTVLSTYRVWFIDFGQSCFDLSRCQTCDVNVRLTAGFSSYKYICDTVSCSNFTFDLRFLFGWVSHIVKTAQQVTPAMRRLDKLYFQRAFTDVKDYPLATQKPHHVISTVNIMNPLFSPTHALEMLLSDGKSTKTVPRATRILSATDKLRLENELLKKRLQVRQLITSKSPISP